MNLILKETLKAFAGRIKQLIPTNTSDLINDGEGGSPASKFVVEDNLMFKDYVNREDSVNTQPGILIPFAEILDCSEVGNQIVIDLPAGYMFIIFSQNNTGPGYIGFNTNRFGYQSSNECGYWSSNPVLSFDYYYSNAEYLKYFDSNDQSCSSSNLQISDNSYYMPMTVPYYGQSSAYSSINSQYYIPGGTQFRITVRQAAVSNGNNPHNKILVYGRFFGRYWPYSPALSNN